MRLILVRHGKTYENANDITQGQRDTKLNEEGIKQSRSLARYLKNKTIDVAYSSDLSRTVDTANSILFFHPNVKLFKKKEIREWARGIYEGKSKDLLRQAIKKTDRPREEFEPECGEGSMYVVQKRAVAFLNELFEKHKEENILVVSHGGVIGSLLLHLFGESFESYSKYRPKNTAVTILDINDKKDKTLHLLNSIKHLE